MAALDDLPILSFPSAAAWRAWLEAHHAGHAGGWLKLYKKGAAEPLPTYAEALDEALCYGWVDGRKRTGDDGHYLQHFTPRRPRSVWSQRNKAHVARLTAEGRMRPAGLASVEAARANGAWEAAYAPQSTMDVPEDFAAALAEAPEAAAFFEALSRTNRYAFLYRIQSVKKAETRARKIAWAIAKLSEGWAPHP